MNKDAQITNRVLMIEPVSFGLNPESIEDNFFQPRSSSAPDTRDASVQACREFATLVETLKQAGVEVTTYTPPAEPRTPDAVFPNNWFSTHEEGILCLYPMRHPNRRLERRPEIVERLRAEYPQVIDYSSFENRGLFLESTGSMVLDRKNRLCFAALSQRTSRELVERWCDEMSFSPVLFNAIDPEGHPIYHTNVLMSLGRSFAVVCLDAVSVEDERELLTKRLRETEKTIIPITLPQLYSYCGNCIELQGTQGTILAMSTQAWNGFTPEQKDTMSLFCPVITSPVDTIERLGGGSVRCMLSELF